MSQNTVVIVDGSGLQVLGYMNDAFNTLITNNSGSTEPATKYAYQFWADTTAGLLKIRNSANNAWITVGSLGSENLGLIPTSAIGSTVQAYNANTAVTNAVQSFSAAQRGSITALTDGATITPDFAAANNFSVTLGGNRTLANPSNLTAGQSGSIVITQDGTGSRTLAYGTYWKFPSGTAPTLTTTASAVDVLVYYVESATRITARLIGDVK